MLGHERIKAYGLVASALMAVTLTFSVKALDSLSIQVEPLHYEVISDEEIHTYFQEKEQTKNLSVNGNVEVVEVGQLTKELPQESVKVNEFTQEEAKLFMKMAQAEAGNQGIDGMWLVMSVALNRVRSENYPDNITDVINQKACKKNGSVVYQFSSVADGRIEDQTILSYEVHEALAKIERGDVAEEIIGFEVKSSNDLDRYFDYAFTYKDHKFYTERKEK